MASARPTGRGTALRSPAAQNSCLGCSARDRRTLTAIDLAGAPGMPISGTAPDSGATNAATVSVVESRHSFASSVWNGTANAERAKARRHLAKSRVSMDVGTPKEGYSNS